MCVWSSEYVCVFFVFVVCVCVCVCVFSRVRVPVCGGLSGLFRSLMGFVQFFLFFFLNTGVYT